MVGCHCQGCRGRQGEQALHPCTRGQETIPRGWMEEGRWLDWIFLHFWLKVRELPALQVRVHYIGGTEEEDEIIDVTSGRLRQAKKLGLSPPTSFRSTIDTLIFQQRQSIK